eukprot:965112-Pelagomonas_calceolata.AAC.1
MREGAEMDCPLQTMHLCFLKRILGQQHYTQYVLQADVEMNSLSLWAAYSHEGVCCEFEKKAA